MTRLAVFAYSGTGYACLKLLLDRGERIGFLATHRDDPSEKRWFPSVAELARSRGIEPVVMENPLDPQSIVRLRIAAPDLVFSFYYRRVLPEEMLGGPAPRGLQHARLAPAEVSRPGAGELGGPERRDAHRGDAARDDAARRTPAPIVDQEAVPIGPEDTAFEVQKRVDAAAVAILARRLEELKAGTAPSRPQDDAAATRFGRRRPEDGRIDWSRPAREVHDLVRAVTHPYPGAFTDLFGPKTFVWRTRLPGLAAHDTFPGQVRAEEGRLHVACGDDRYVEILSLQSDGGEETDAAGWLAARAHA